MKCFLFIQIIGIWIDFIQIRTYIYVYYVYFPNNFTGVNIECKIFPLYIFYSYKKPCFPFFFKYFQIRTTTAEPAIHDYIIAHQMTDNNEIDTLSCTLDLSAIDSAEVDKLNNPNLLSLI